jgi:hypothetical protein
MYREYAQKLMEKCPYAFAFECMGRAYIFGPSSLL